MKSHVPKFNWLLVGFALLPAVISPLLELWLNRSEDKTDPAALMAGLFTLTALGILGWLLFRPTPRQIGFRLGHKRNYLLTLLYVLWVMAMAFACAALTGNVSTAGFEPLEFAKNLGLMFVATLIGVLITEEGFYRGVLWGIFEKFRTHPMVIFLITSAAFAAWHVYLPFVEPEFDLPAWQVPIYLTNVLLIAFCWGWIRLASGSLWLCSLIHALWNAVAYTIFGAGVSDGKFDVQQIWIFGPERGLLGIVLNAMALGFLIRFMPRGDAQQRGEDT